MRIWEGLGQCILYPVLLIDVPLFVGYRNRIVLSNVSFLFCALSPITFVVCIFINTAKA